jgi:hypothetical protein
MVCAGLCDVLDGAAPVALTPESLLPLAPCWLSMLIAVRNAHGHTALLPAEPTNLHNPNTPTLAMVRDVRFGSVHLDVPPAHAAALVEVQPTALAALRSVAIITASARRHGVDLARSLSPCSVTREEHPMKMIFGCLLVLTVTALAAEQVLPDAQPLPPVPESRQNTEQTPLNGTAAVERPGPFRQRRTRLNPLPSA